MASRLSVKIITRVVFSAITSGIIWAPRRMACSSSSVVEMRSLIEKHFVLVRLRSVAASAMRRRVSSMDPCVRIVAPVDCTLDVAVAVSFVDGCG